MNVLQRGSQDLDEDGDVRQWQLFLRGEMLYFGVIDGDFGPQTESATKSFQIKYDIQPSGVFDSETQAEAATQGFELQLDSRQDQAGPNWPARPVDLDPLSQEGRQKLFGAFKFIPKPSAGNQEAILVDATWVRTNIVQVQIAHSNRSVPFHTLGAEKLHALFAAWAADGLLDRLKTWDGSYAPRFIRGSRTVLSAHAWGSAFDINACYNQLGAIPALFGKKGCVRELVSRANEFGFYWGGHFPGRKDGMHFELVRLT